MLCSVFCKSECSLVSIFLAHGSLLACRWWDTRSCTALHPLCVSSSFCSFHSCMCTFLNSCAAFTPSIQSNVGILAASWNLLELEVDQKWMAVGSVASPQPVSLVVQCSPCFTRCGGVAATLLSCCVHNRSCWRDCMFLEVDWIKSILVTLPWQRTEGKEECVWPAKHTSSPGRSNFSYNGAITETQWNRVKWQIHTSLYVQTKSKNTLQRPSKGFSACSKATKSKKILPVISESSDLSSLSSK